MAALTEVTGTVFVQYEPDHYAERLRIRRGQIVRWAWNGKVTDYRVTRVSMPDSRGQVQVDVTAA